MDLYDRYGRRVVSGRRPVEEVVVVERGGLADEIVEDLVAEEIAEEIVEDLSDW